MRAALCIYHTCLVQFAQTVSCVDYLRLIVCTCMCIQGKSEREGKGERRRETERKREREREREREGEAETNRCMYVIAQEGKTASTTSHT